MTKKVKAKKVSNLDHPWIIVDEDTGEILDDAQGYGYRTAQKAHAAYAYRHRTPSQKKRSKNNKKKAKEWWTRHSKEAKTLNQFAFEIAKGSWGPNYEFNYNFFKEFVEENKIDTENCNMYSLWQYYMHNL